MDGDLMRGGIGLFHCLFFLQGVFRGGLSTGCGDRCSGRRFISVRQKNGQEKIRRVHFLGQETCIYVNVNINGCTIYINVFRPLSSFRPLAFSKML